jgi:hypothetical protein
MKKQHQFILTVTTDGSKESARIAVLTAMCKRMPDGCEFNLKADSSYKEAWMAGSESGTALAFDLVTKTLEGLKTTLGAARKPKRRRATKGAGR